MTTLVLALPAAAVAQTGLRLTYLGTAGWEITDGRTTVLVDPYLTRAKYETPNDPVLRSDPRPVVTNASIVPSDTAVINAHITRADVIVITHTHPDHALDLPYIATKTRATVIGTQSTINLARASGVSERQLAPASGRETFTFNDVTIRVIPSLHGIFRRPAPNAPPPTPAVFPADSAPPFRYGQYAEGGTLAYSIRIAGHEIVVFGSMNFIESELMSFRPEIALIGAMPERSLIDNYTPRLMAALGNPRIVLPTHWDTFNVPFSVSQQFAIARVQSFLDEVKAASPTTRIFVPEHFKPIWIDSLRPAGLSLFHYEHGIEKARFIARTLGVNLDGFTPAARLLSERK